MGGRRASAVAAARTDLHNADQLLESFLTLARAESGRLEERNQVALETIVTAGLDARSDQIAAKQLDG